LLGLVAWAALVVFFAVMSSDGWHHISKGDYGRFPTIYWAASALRAGKSPYDLPPNLDEYIYPPLYALLCQPLVHFPIRTAARILLTADTLLILLAVVLSARAAALRLGGHGVVPWRVPTVALGASIMACAPLLRELRGLESDALVLFCFALALYWIDRHPIGSGLALALAVNVKYLPLAILPYLVLRRRWLATAATVVWTAVLAALPALLTGWFANITNLHRALGGLVNLTGGSGGSHAARVPGLTRENSLSLTSALARAAEHLGWPRPAALVLAAAVAVPYLVAALAGYASHHFPPLRWPDTRGQKRFPFNSLLALEWAAMITFILTFSPNTQDRHLLLAIIPATIAFTLLLKLPLPPRLLLPVGTALLFLGLLFPIAAMGAPASRAWRASGLPTICLLAGYLCVLRHALAHLRPSAALLTPANPPRLQTSATELPQVTSEFTAQPSPPPTPESSVLLPPPAGCCAPRRAAR
jgi:hypothetical protein